jgi:hypothetical protein
MLLRGKCSFLPLKMQFFARQMQFFFHLLFFLQPLCTIVSRFGPFGQLARFLLLISGLLHLNRELSLELRPFSLEARIFLFEQGIADL